MNTIGNIIRYKRRQLGLTQKQFAKKIGASATSVSTWETGLFYPSVFALCDLADFFGCSVDELLGRTEIKD